MRPDAPRSMGRVRRRGRAAATVALALVAGCGGASDDAGHAGAVASEVRVQISGETVTPSADSTSGGGCLGALLSATVDRVTTNRTSGAAALGGGGSSEVQLDASSKSISVPDRRGVQYKFPFDTSSGKRYIYFDLASRTTNPLSYVDSTGTTQKLAQISMAKFNNPEGLQRISGNLFAQSNNSGNATSSFPGDPATGMGSLQSGAVEMSNVDLAQEFTTMITAQRGYEANSRVISTADQVLQNLVQLGR